MGNALFENARGGPHGCFITLPGWIHHVSLDVLAVHKIQGNFGHNFGVTLSSVNCLLLHQKKGFSLVFCQAQIPLLEYGASVKKETHPSVCLLESLWTKHWRLDEASPLVKARDLRVNLTEWWNKLNKISSFGVLRMVAMVIIWSFQNLATKEPGGGMKKNPARFSNLPVGWNASGLCWWLAFSKSRQGNATLQGDIGSINSHDISIGDGKSSTQVRRGL